MTISGVRPRLAAFLTAIVVSVGLQGLSSAPVRAEAGTVTEFPVPSRGGPEFITAGPDGNLWFTEEAGNKIGRITMSYCACPRRAFRHGTCDVFWHHSSHAVSWPISVFVMLS